MAQSAKETETKNVAKLSAQQKVKRKQRKTPITKLDSIEWS